MCATYIEAVYYDKNLVKINLETLLVVHVYHICDTNNVKLNIVYKENLQPPLFLLDLTKINHKVVSFVPELVSYCIWPAIVIDKTVIAGLCSVSRQIIKSSKNKELRILLGFKEASLLACSENSGWTKFCEIEVPKAVCNVLINLKQYVKDGVIFLPPELTKFEYHMQQPVRMHNIYKVAREKHNDKTIKSSVPLEELNLEHIYGQGSIMTIVDILLFPCFQILFEVFKIESLRSELPLSITWFNNMQCCNLRSIEFKLPMLSTNCYVEDYQIMQENNAKESLCTSDPSRYNSQNRIFTKQTDIDKSIDIIKKLDFDASNDFEPFGSDVEFDWTLVPIQASPFGGALPKKRAKRKCEQLENVARAVIKLVGIREYTIVDFCSGSGHLGILLATLLPNCKIILVENKEYSLLRAKHAVTQLNLKNVTLLQCNLDYFSAKYDVGVALHACGVATDLVIQNCIKNKAHFVCCPCCYGSIHDCYQLTYPRSKELLNSIMNYNDYLSIAHAADQTHDSDNAKTKQGYMCMDIIDTDRKLQATNCGYIVYLGKLQPTSCTPKNNLLVGVCKT